MIYSRGTSFKMLRQTDKGFYINDGAVVTGRASMEISKNCPSQYRQMIGYCVSQGWLQPVATLTERELLFLGLSDERSNSTIT